jgi:hypothetical protein
MINRIRKEKEASKAMVEKIKDELSKCEQKNFESLKEIRNWREHSRQMESRVK